MLSFSTFNKYSWLLILLSVLGSMLSGFSQFMCLPRTIPVEGSKVTAVISLHHLHFSGSVKEVGFRWALSCNSCVFYVVTPNAS